MNRDAGASRDLWIASANPKKRGELVRLLAPLGFTIRTLDEVDTRLGPMPEFVEDRPDFSGNAAVKATTLARHLGADAIALGDDSGLCVEALDGEPGVRSARWAGPDATDADRNRLLLERLAGRPTPERAAQFVCAICVATAEDVVAQVTGTCEGHLTTEPRGEAGFGYDPLFVPDDENPRGQTFAELTAEQKDRVSHRGRALRALRERLEGWQQGAGCQQETQ